MGVGGQSGEREKASPDARAAPEEDGSAQLKATERAVHAEVITDFLEALEHGSNHGLAEPEAERRLQVYGPNRLPDAPKKSNLLRLVEQFANPLVLTLLAAAVIAVVVGVMNGGTGGSLLVRFGDAAAILLIVVLNAFLGFYQERRAEAALDALQKMSAPNARLRRAGQIVVVPAAAVVPGDILELEAGNSVPADARLVQTIDLSTEEAALTGESSAISKDAMAPVARDAPLANRVTMVFTGTTVVRGKGRAVVTATGTHTELGRIGEMMREVGDQKTPLEQRLERFGSQILRACLALSAVLLAWGFARGGRSWDELLLEAVSLAVAAIPEGLPAITTITLALGMQRMARRGAIVRKLPAVETLGAATIIASDKTGTLTRNEMTVRSVYAGGVRYAVTGEGYDPVGFFRALTDQGRSGADLDGDNLPKPLVYTLTTAALCNNAQLSRAPVEGGGGGEGAWKVVGDPTEGALLAVAAKAGMTRDELGPAHEFVHELPFDSDRKRMTVITRDKTGRTIAHVKGSVDVLLPLCVKFSGERGPQDLTEEDRRAILAEADRMSGKALRVLALCRRVRKGAISLELTYPGTGPISANVAAEAEEVERELTFLGLVGMMDPPRAGVKEAVATCARAGIRAVMITGDHRLTATAIAREIGLWAEGDEAITGAELAQLDDAELQARIMKLRVFARTTAEQKLRIVRAFKARGHVVAMTGDGVNDAPALREAHIGVAMGKGGTDVARQAADLVLADDNFVTIVEAVREGRAIYRNIQKFIFFLLSSNMGLLVAVFTVSLFKSWPPLTPLMILWINLVTNGLPALALGIDPPEEHLMREPPRNPNEGLLSRRDYFGILYVGVVMGAAAVGLYAFGPHDPEGLKHTRAVAFSLLALSPLFHAWSCRSPVLSVLSTRPLFSAPLFMAATASAAIHLVAVLVPGLRPVFRTYEMSATEWLVMLGLAALIVPAVEVAKMVYRRTRPAVVAPPTTPPAPARP